MIIGTVICGNCGIKYDIMFDDFGNKDPDKKCPACGSKELFESS